LFGLGLGVFWRQGLAVFESRLASNSKSSCLRLLSAEVTGVCHHSCK
jgi:hypothetical protein